MEDWYKYLQQISKEVKLQEYKNSFIATNNIIQSQKELYDGMEM